MNVYDFDQTIFQFDSSCCFILYCLRHYTRAVLPVLPSSAFHCVQYLTHGRKDAKNLKESLFSFLNRIDNIERVVSEFWAENESGLKSWYIGQKQSDDVIISASPSFLLEPVAAKLGVTLIATKMNPYTGKISGRNCHDKEKVFRFRELYPNAVVHSFYSDSLSDSPMAILACKAFLVNGEAIQPWPVTS